MIPHHSWALALASLKSRGETLISANAVDLACFMGPWRVIACMDNAMEHEMVDATETFVLREDGTVEVHHRWREKSFTAEEQTFETLCQVAEKKRGTCWRTKLFPLLTTTFVVLAVHPQYEWAAMAHPSRQFGWILSRSRSVDARTYRQILSTFEHQGFDIRKFIKIPQVVRHDKYMMAALPLPAFKCA